MIDELLSLGEQPARTVTGAGEDVLAIGHAWFTRVIRSLRGVRLMEKAGLAHEAAPIVRTAIEFAVAIHWLASNGIEAVDVLRREQQAWVARVDKAQIEAGGWDRLPPELFEQIAAVEMPKVPDDGKIKTKFTRTGQHNLYVAWLSETAMSHPTLSSATPYVPQDARGRYSLLSEPSTEGSEDAELRCAVAAVVAAFGMASVLGSPEWERRAQALDTSLGQVLAARVAS